MAKEYSGKLVLRIDPVLHRELAKHAGKKFMSLNGLINSILNEEIKKSKKVLVVSK